MSMGPQLRRRPLRPTGQTVTGKWQAMQRLAAGANRAWGLEIQPRIDPEDGAAGAASARSGAGCLQNRREDGVLWEVGGKAPCDAHFQLTFNGTFQGDRMDGTAGRRFAAAGSIAMSAAWALGWALGWALLGGPAQAWQAAAPAPAAAKPAGGGAVPAEGAVVEVDVVEVVVIEAPPAPSELVEAVKKAEIATIEAFNKGDAAALAALFAEKGELVDENGNVFAGREQITGLFKAFFERFPKAELQMEVTGVRTVGDSLAIEEGVRLITVPETDVAAQLRYTAVRDKVGDSWPIASYSEFADDPSPTPAEMLSAVSFLVGDWIDESPEGKTTINYRWEDEGNFLLGDYTLAVAGMPESRSHQRIGWDPLEGVIRSWTFDSDGGFSTGEWVPTEAGWVIKSDATMPDGTTGSATVTVTPTDADHFIVRSSDRIIGGVDEPEFELTVARRPPQPEGALPAGEAKPAAPPAAEAPKAVPAQPAPAAKPAVPATPTTPAVKAVPNTPAAPVPVGVKPATPAPVGGVKPAVPGTPAVPGLPVVPGKPLGT